MQQRKRFVLAVAVFRGACEKLARIVCAIVGCLSACAVCKVKAVVRHVLVLWNEAGWSNLIFAVPVAGI